MKYWDECSRKERDEVNNIKRIYKTIKKAYIDGIVTKRDYITVLDVLIYKLDECYEKYAE